MGPRKGDQSDLQPKRHRKAARTLDGRVVIAAERVYSKARGEATCLKIIYTRYPPKAAVQSVADQVDDPADWLFACGCKPQIIVRILRCLARWTD